MEEQNRKAHPTNRKRKRIRRSLSLVLSYILSLVFFLLFVLIGIKAGVFNNNVILDRLNKSNYYHSIYETVLDNVESVLLPTGLNESVLNSVITMDMVYIGAKNTIEGTIRGEQVTQDTSGLENRLIKNIEDYAAENGIAYGTEQGQGLIKLSKDIAFEYTRMMDFPFINYYVKYRSIYDKLFVILVPVLLVIAGFIIVMLLRMQRYKHRAVRYIEYSTLASTIMISLFPLYLLISGNYRKINVSPRYFYDFMVGYLKWDIEVFLYIGGIGLIISLSLLLLIGNLKRRISQ